MRHTGFRRLMVVNGTPRSGCHSTSMCPSGDSNRYKSDISTSMCPSGDLNQYKSDFSTSMCPSGDLNKYKVDVSTSRCISSIYESMKNSYICYCYMLYLNENYCMCICTSYMIPTKRKA